MSNEKNATPTRVITGPHTVFSYLHVNEPKMPPDGGTPKYSASLIIPKDDTKTVEAIRSAIRAAYAEGENKLKGSNRKAPALEDIRTPLRDGDKDRPDDEAYQDAWYMNASSISKPGIVDRNRDPILDPLELYSGMIGRASVTFYAYNVNGNRGIACGLNNIQKLKDGKPLGGHRRAEDDFAGLDDDDEDEDGFLD